MGRPSLAQARTEQIVQAAVACIDRLGLRRTSLERVAEESGLSRSHIRHYVVNRDGMMRLAWARIDQEFFDQCAAKSASSNQPAQSLLEALLGQTEALSPKIWRLLSDASQDRAVSEAALQTLQRIELELTQALAKGAAPEPSRPALGPQSENHETKAAQLASFALGQAVRQALE